MSLTQRGQAYIDVPISYDSWQRITEGAGWDHEKAIPMFRRRAIEHLRQKRPNWKEDEIQFVADDTVFQESCRQGYYTALTGLQRRRRLPSAIRVRFTRPGTQSEGEVDQ